MEITSAGANKMLRALRDERSYLERMEERSREYVLAENEKQEPPAYDYEETTAKMQEIDRKICRIKHAVNVFNTTTVLEKQGITIDEALVKMAQMTQSRLRLEDMRSRLPKTRHESYGHSSLIEYAYLNYDVKKVQEDYRKLNEEIMELQLELDACNQTRTFELEL